MLLFFVAILLASAFLGYMIHWMSETYGAESSSLGKGVSIAGYTLTPLFVCGLTGFYPVLWLDMLLGCAAAAYTVYLLYIGVPIVMQIPKERGFLFASAMVGCWSGIVRSVTGCNRYPLGNGCHASFHGLSLSRINGFTDTVFLACPVGVARS